MEGQLLMECLKNFLSESYQRRLRLLAQSKSDRYEDTLKNYCDTFCAHFELVMNNKCKNRDCIYYLSCNYVYSIIEKIKKDEIFDFFNRVRQIYLEWIDSEITNALGQFDKLMSEFNLLHFEKEIKEYDLFFRGRVSEQVLTSWDMFHIPFNRRYLINNQRYSLTGQPMLYIGSSVLDIVEEIEAENLKNLKVSMVRLNADSLKIYSLQSNITDELVDLDVDLLFNDESDIYNKSNFFRMLLASVCSFQRRQELKGFNFCEEYVLPQMLAQILKRKGFDGVAYYSTKRYENLVYSEDGVKKDLAYFRDDNFEFKENIAIFTKINMEHVYDRQLYDKIQISVPVSQQRIERITIEDIKELCELIAASKKQKNITAAEKIVSSFGRIYDKMYIDDQKYEQTEFGKLHCYLVFTVLSQILIS